MFGIYGAAGIGARGSGRAGLLRARRTAAGRISENFTNIGKKF
jgi:hypothetical protein